MQVEESHDMKRLYDILQNISIYTFFENDGNMRIIGDIVFFYNSLI